MYQDEHDHIVTRKASQIYMTELALVDVFSLAAQKIPGMYILPTDSFMWDFVKERVNLIIDHTETYKEGVKRGPRDPDSLSLKRIFGVPWRFTGAHNRKNFYSFTAGAIIVDEYDLCNQDNLVYAEDRLLSQDRRIIRYFGNPSLPGFGIDGLYDQSDKRIWMIKCSHCNEWQGLDWFTQFVEKDDAENYRLRDKRYADAVELDHSAGPKNDAKGFCVKCGRDINRLAQGEWVIEYPSRYSHGYAVSRLFADSTNRAVILEMFFGRDGFRNAIEHTIKYQRFLNNILGIPFKAEGAQIDLEMIQACVADYLTPGSVPMEDGRPIETVMGVDVNPGKGHRVHVEQILDDGTRKKLVAFRVNSWPDLHKAAEEWNVAIGVIDAQPEISKAAEFCREHPGWFRCFYPTSEQVKAVDFQVDFVQQFVKVDRTASLDRGYQDWRLHKIQVARDFHRWNQGKFVDEMAAAVRVYLPPKGLQTSGRYVWAEGNKDDHDRHSDNYVRIAGTLYGGGGSGVEVISSE